MLALGFEERIKR